MGLAWNAAAEQGTPGPLIAAAHAIYSQMCAEGYAHLDFGSVYKFITENAKESK